MSLAMVVFTTLFITALLFIVMISCWSNPPDAETHRTLEDQIAAGIYRGSGYHE
jgi:hypothetical protein